jgi:DNA-binding NarL/FixJ family response regulator
MENSNSQKPHRILIASNHSLFLNGLKRLLEEREEGDVRVVGLVKNLQETLTAIDELDPDLIVVDYDDDALNRDEFLARFVEGEKEMRVVLLSLQGSSDAVVYDRRNMSASLIDNWLEKWRHAE